MPTKLITFLVVLTLLLGLNWLGSQQGYPELPDNLMFQRIDGTVQTMQELKGKPLLVTFWPSSCAICMQAVDVLKHLSADL